jgi:NAD(P)-dependent dehydrogenase (short-subunit alcohol dehydrogenase family)
MASFEGKTLLVTGGATGLGRAVAELAGASGAQVAVLDINEEAGRETARKVGGKFWWLDVADPADWARVTDRVRDAFGQIHYAHLNAGIMTQEVGGSLAQVRIEDISSKRYREVMGVNVDGVFFGIQTLLSSMNAGEGEAITVTISAAGLVPIPFDPVYATAKHALVGLVRSLALTYKDERTRINAICPGGFVSPLLPLEFRHAATMTAAEIAAEVVDLLLSGAMGETRLKLRADAPAEAVLPPLSSLA